MAYTVVAGESEWLSSDAHASTDVMDETASPLDAQPPAHPVPTMQGAFEESMMETMTEVEESELDNRYSTADSISRRKMLLEQERYERTVAGRWKQKPGEKFHPLWKLVAQISFGMHLLQQGMAKSDDEVIKILQTHVDEVDGFLERTTEDFDLAQEDINDRIRYLRLPLDHGDVFDTMLDDRAFRTAIVEGNEKIEHIVDRTAAAMKDALKDVHKGLDATRELARYLARLDTVWANRSRGHGGVFMAMMGNAEGWSGAFVTLQQKGNALGISLVQLGGIIAEMQRRAGIASRRNLTPARSIIEGKYYVEPKSTSTSPRYSYTPPDSPNKPLPRAPSLAPGVVSNSIPPKQVKQPSKLSIEQGQTEVNGKPAKSSPPAKLVKKASKSAVENNSVSPPQPGPENAIFQTNLSKSNSPSISTVPPKEPVHKVSFSERTRSLTKKLSFFKDSEESDGLGVLPLRDPRIERVETNSPSNPKPRTTSSNSWAQSSPNHRRAQSQEEFMDDPKSLISGAVSPSSLDAEYAIPDEDTIFALLAHPSMPSSRPDSSNSSAAARRRMKAKTVMDDVDEGSVNHSHPLLKDIRAKEVRFSSTAPGTPPRQASKDLPLRDYRSQESLSMTKVTNGQAKILNIPRRSSSVRTTPSTTYTTPAADSLINSPGTLSSGEPSSLYPSEGKVSSRSSSKLWADFPSTGLRLSTTSNSEGQPSARASSTTYPTELQTQTSSIYSPEAKSSIHSADIKSTSQSPETKSSSLFASPAFPTMLSPPPEKSSATPSPLHIATKHPTTTTPPSKSPTTTISPPLPPPALDITKAPRPSTPRTYTPPETLAASLSALTSATVSGPEPDLFPYDLAASSTTPTVSSSAEPSSYPSPILSSTTNSAAAATYRTVHHFAEPSSSPAPPGPGGRPMTTGTVDEKSGGRSSPWKKVFGPLVGGGGGGGGGRGHRKSKSEKVVVVPAGKGIGVGVWEGRKMGKVRTREHVEGGAGPGGEFMGVGRDGVWISRKNFVKT